MSASACAGLAWTGLAGPGAQAAAGRIDPPGTISTLAGGVGGPGPARSVAVAPCGVASLRALCGLAFAGGRLYTTDIGVDNLNAVRMGCVVRAIDMNGGMLATPAGNGVPGYSGDGGPAGAAQLRCPADVAVDAAGNVAIADFANERVRVVAAATGTFYGIAMTAGDIYTVAGDGRFAPPVSGEPALSAPIVPVQVAIDHSGNLIIGDAPDPVATIWVVAAHTGTFYGQAMTAGDIYRIAGGRATGNGGPALKAFLGGFLGAIKVDRHGNLVVAVSAASRIRVIATTTGRFYRQNMTAGHIYTVAGGGTGGGSDHLGDGGPATKAIIRGASGVALDGRGNLVIADSGDNRIRVVAAAAGTFYGRKMTAGDIYSVAGGGRSLMPGAAAGKAFLDHPRVVAVDSAGNIAVADAFARRLRLVAERTGTFYGMAMRAGHVYAIAGTGQVWLSGTGGPATAAQLLPASEAIGRGGNLLVADASDDTFRSEIRAVAATTGTFFGEQMTAGDIYTVAGLGLDGYSGDGGPAVRARLRLSTPHTGGVAIAAAGSGNLVIADGGNYRVRVVADRSGRFYGIAMKAGYIYTVAGTGVQGFSGDGGLATRARLEFFNGLGVAVDKSGNIALADPTDGVIRMVAARNGTFYGVPMKADHIYRIAGIPGTIGFAGDGGPALQAEFNLQLGLAVDGAGNLLIADSDNQRIRVIAATTGTFYGQPMTAGDIYTVAGHGATNCTSGDGGPAIDACLAATSVSVDPHGNLLIAGSASRVRIVAAVTGTFYGIPMTAGDIYTVAGTSTGGYSGDGGPATAAQLYLPADVVASAAGIYIADAGNARIRLVTP